MLSAVVVRSDLCTAGNLADVVLGYDTVAEYVVRSSRSLSSLWLSSLDGILCE